MNTLVVFVVRNSCESFWLACERIEDRLVLIITGTSKHIKRPFSRLACPVMQSLDSRIEGTTAGLVPESPVRMAQPGRYAMSFQVGP
jgi:hypothetical protein